MQEDMTILCRSSKLSNVKCKCVSLAVFIWANSHTVRANYLQYFSPMSFSTHNNVTNTKFTHMPRYAPPHDKGLSACYELYYSYRECRKSCTSTPRYTTQHSHMICIGTVHLVVWIQRLALWRRVAYL